MQANVPVSRLGDKSDHGGEIVTATANMQIGGIEVARTGDIHRCPIHGDTPVTGFSTMRYKDFPLLHVGSKAECGAVIVTGSDTLETSVKEADYGDA
jgi:uncharacterized Zn-binding protein involved in type VI secretion